MIELLLGQTGYSLVMSAVILDRYIRRGTASAWVATHILLVAGSYLLSQLALVISLALSLYAPLSILGLMSWLSFVIGDYGLLVMLYYQRRAP